MNESIGFNPSRHSHKVRYFSLGRHALLASLEILQIKKGDLALIPGFICRDLLAAFHELGVGLVFYEVNRSMEPVRLPVEKGIRVVVAVNYFGFPQNLMPFRNYCLEFDALLIEDNAHGFMSRDETGALLGSRGDIGFFSIRKSILLPDGAMLMLNDDRFFKNLPVQPDFRKDMLPLSYWMKKFFVKIEHNLGIRFMFYGKNLVRGLRKLLIGYSIVPSSPGFEFNIPMGPSAHECLLKELQRLDQNKEILRRRKLYEEVSTVFNSINVRPVFKNLPAHVVPYGFPFFAYDRDTTIAINLARKLGLDCAYWPDLPSEIEGNAPDHYCSLLIVYFT